MFKAIKNWFALFPEEKPNYNLAPKAQWAPLNEKMDQCVSGFNTCDKQLPVQISGGGGGSRGSSGGDDAEPFLIDSTGWLSMDAKRIHAAMAEGIISTEEGEALLGKPDLLQEAAQKKSSIDANIAAEMRECYELREFKKNVILMNNILLSNLKAAFSFVAEIVGHFEDVSTHFDADSLERTNIPKLLLDLTATKELIMDCTATVLDLENFKPQLPKMHLMHPEAVRCILDVAAADEEIKKYQEEAMNLPSLAAIGKEIVEGMKRCSENSNETIEKLPPLELRTKLARMLREAEGFNAIVIGRIQPQTKANFIIWTEQDEEIVRMVQASKDLISECIEILEGPPSADKIYTVQTGTVASISGHEVDWMLNPEASIKDVKPKKSHLKLVPKKVVKIDLAKAFPAKLKPKKDTLSTKRKNSGRKKK